MVQNKNLRCRLVTILLLCALTVSCSPSVIAQDATAGTVDAAAVDTTAPVTDTSAPVTDTPAPTGTEAAAVTPVDTSAPTDMPAPAPTDAAVTVTFVDTAAPTDTPAPPSIVPIDTSAPTPPTTAADTPAPTTVTTDPPVSSDAQKSAPTATTASQVTPSAGGNAAVTANDGSSVSASSGSSTTAIPPIATKSSPLTSLGPATDSASDSNGSNEATTSGTSKSSKNIIAMGLIGGSCAFAVIMVFAARAIKRRRDDDKDGPMTPLPQYTVTTLPTSRTSPAPPVVSTTRLQSNELRRDTKSSSAQGSVNYSVSSTPMIEGIKSWNTSPALTVDCVNSAPEASPFDLNSYRSRNNTNTSACTIEEDSCYRSRKDTVNSNLSLASERVSRINFNIRDSTQSDMSSLDDRLSYSSQISAYSRQNNSGAFSIKDTTGSNTSLASSVVTVVPVVTEDETTTPQRTGRASSDWYKSISSPTEMDRYTDGSDTGTAIRMSSDRDSYEL